MMTDRILSHSSFSHIVDVPIERIDIADWLFNLPEAEYQRCCPPDHIAAGATSTDNGRRMSINVEMVGETLMIQHYIGEITEPHLCRMVSLSDAFTPNGRTKVQVLWELSVIIRVIVFAISCRFSSAFQTLPTPTMLPIPTIPQLTGNTRTV
jgi:hypothetical protein